MMVSTRGRYALRAMIDIAEHSNGEYIPLRDIADRQDISEKYLESILPVLTKADFLEGLRGKGGGYKLSRAPESYTVNSILKLTEGSMAPIACLESSSKKCPRASQCPTLPMWQKFQTMANEFFEGVSIADLCNSKQNGNDYMI